MKHPKRDVQYFLKDESFVQWVLQPNDELDRYWKGWMKQHPEQMREVKVAQEMINGFQYQQQHHLPDNTYHAMLDSLLTQHISAPPVVNKRSNPWVLRVAASLLLMIMVGWAVWYAIQPEPTTDTEPVSLMMKRTRKGEKRTVRLPDGTKVKLNANSVLVYPTEFDHKVRSVRLEGEALFDVTKDADRPFIIMSGDVKTQVLGTSFNVRAYDEEPGVTVAVVTGKVKVRGKRTSELYLLPEDVSYYHRSDSSLSTSSQSVTDLTAWSRNILLFDEDPAEEVWRKLENWYGVNIILPDQPVITGNYSGRYHNEALSRVLDGISYASEFAYEIQENKNVIIKPLPMQHKRATN
uniref:FecR domain-containing protein n=1 Tax=Roseihalotalea indica TaxID=2867963 RepID=A0AA49JCM2_9BACT|nr:FecR domain-containing protein [Tunicatimonas sp. TK19036]